MAAQAAAWAACTKPQEKAGAVQGRPGYAGAPFFSGGAGFSLWPLGLAMGRNLGVLVIASTKGHRLKPAPLHCALNGKKRQVVRLFQAFSKNQEVLKTFGNKSRRLQPRVPRCERVDSP